MPTYLSPGVYVEEVPGAVQPIEGVGTSTGAFVGLAERGELDQAKLITNFTQFATEFGTFIPNSYLAYAVFNFFAEGGTRCYVTRVAGNGAAAATLTLNGGDSNPALKIDARSPGLWGDRISIAVGDPGAEDPATHFKLTVRYQEANQSEYPTADTYVTTEYDNLSAATVEDRLNGISAFVNVTYQPLADPAQETARTLANKRPANSAPDTFTSLAAGNDGAPTPDFIGSEIDKTGLHAFDPIDDVNIVAIPDIAGDRNNILSAVNYCELRGDCFFLVDPPLSITPLEAKDFRQGTGTYSGNAFNSSFAAMYYPWVVINDPLTGRTRSVPPSGVVAGTYSNTDSTRGVHKAPAGTVDGFLNSVVGVEELITKGEQDVLNPLGVNVIRSFPQAGIVIWGARTLSNLPEWRYVNVRRLMLFIGESLDEGSQFVVFEPNDPTLWGKVRRTINAFLTRVWRDGALFGNTPQEAFFVKVDEENNPPEVRDAGQLIIEVGVAPVKPAEFVIIRISQQTQAGA